MKRVRWGLLSTARINRRIIPAFRATKRGELAAVASRNKDAAEAYARDWEIPLAFGSYQEMLDSGTVDAVYIPLPNHLHAEWTIKALEAGLHVLCEKPFAPTLAEVDQMMAKAAETGLVLAEAFMYRHHPQTKIIGDWVGAGRLGEITLVSGAFNYAMLGQDRVDNIRLVQEWGGGCLWDVGVYPLSFAQFIMGGPPEWVAGSQWIGETGVDEVFSGHLHYRGNRVAQITSSFRTPFYTFVEIEGTEGRIRLDRPFVHPHEASPVFYPATGEPQTIRVPNEHLYLGEVEDMQSAILDGRPNYLSLAETRNHVRTALALYESADKAEVVWLEDLA